MSRQQVAMSDLLASVLCQGGSDYAEEHNYLTEHSIYRDINSEREVKITQEKQQNCFNLDQEVKPGL